MTTRPLRRDFSSDNIAGIDPAILTSLTTANDGTVHSYGADPQTEALQAAMNSLFETPVAVLPVATGTAANAIALATLAKPYQGIYCPASGHVNTDECGAPEFYSGGKLLGLPTSDGKLRPGQVREAVAFAHSMGVHHVDPAAVSISEATEWGTVYTPDEVAALAEEAHALGLKLHMDGARFGNAVAHLGCSAAEITWKAGVDILSFGATKNGALAAEAIIAFDPALSRDLEFRRKRGGHLWSKLRFLSAQLNAYVDQDRWLVNARAANAVAARLAVGLASLPGVTVLMPTEANEVFVALPDDVLARLKAAGYEFYDWPAPPGRAVAGTVIRLVAAYDMQLEDADGLLAAARG
jgi:threonine aldolase